MKEIGILYQTDMVQAMLDERAKDVTRRTRGLDIINDHPDEWELNRVETIDQVVNFVFHYAKSGAEFLITSPYGQPGDWHWVRETWAKVPATAYRQSIDIISLPIDQYMVAIYKAGWDRSAPTWKPSIHMPKAAARIWREVVSIRPERLHDITAEDAKREGIHSQVITGFGDPWTNYRNYSGIGKPEFSTFSKYNVDGKSLPAAMVSFKTLWDSINGKPKEGRPDLSWKANPWVWRIETKELSRTGKPEPHSSLSHGEGLGEAQ